jgi:hypothetical protein
MSAEEVDEYLRGVEEPQRSALQTPRRTILEIVPDAEQVISYRGEASLVLTVALPGHRTRQSFDLFCLRDLRRVAATCVART